MKYPLLIGLLLTLCSCLGNEQSVTSETSQVINPVAKQIDDSSFDPATLLWYSAPAKVWEEALPVGNGRLGAMVFGGVDEERIQLNEDTYWSGGPYTTVVKGGHEIEGLK